jgi:biopolymer transport protein ExbD
MRRRKIEGDKEVDLAALVDILANMLFFLLATVSFLQLKTLNASVPALSDKTEVVSDKAVNVTIEIKSTGHVLKVTGQPADKTQKALTIQKDIARLSDGSLDTKSLTKELWEVKKISPETKNVMIFPEQTMPFEDIVRTMDAAREMPSIIDPKKKVPLFPRPVLSELVTGNEQPRDDVPGGAPQ